jgi:hypothetical protein
MLVCPFCGTESPYSIDRDIGKVGERELDAGLRESAAAERDRSDERRSVQCQSCKAIMVYDASRVGQNCEFCGSPALIAYEDIKSPIRPEGVLPFRVDRNRVRDDIRRWWRSKWLAPGRLATAALVDTVKSLYIPYWTFDASAHCPWDAEGRLLLLRQRRRPATTMVAESSARNDACVGNMPQASSITRSTMSSCRGTTGVEMSLLRQVEPFPTQEIVPYDTAFLSGHVVEQYQVALTEAAGDSEAQMRATLEQLCAQTGARRHAPQPGDSSGLLGRTFKHVLVPIWLLVYMFGSRNFQVVVNGYTGRIAGRYPYSPWKIAFLILLAIIVFFLFVIANEN